MPPRQFDRAERTSRRPARSAVEPDPRGDTSRSAGCCDSTKLREIDRRIRFLSKRLDSAVVVDNVGREHDCEYFGATVTVADEEGHERTLSIVGIDELDPVNGRVSWISPIAKALMKAVVGDVVTLKTPSGEEQLEVVDIRYDPLP